MLNLDEPLRDQETFIISLFPPKVLVDILRLGSESVILSTALWTSTVQCTRPNRRHLYSGIYKDPLNRKCEIFKNRRYSLTLCLYLKLEYLFKSCKT